MQLIQTTLLTQVLKTLSHGFCNAVESTLLAASGEEDYHWIDRAYNVCDMETGRIVNLIKDSGLEPMAQAHFQHMSLNVPVVEGEKMTATILITEESDKQNVVFKLPFGNGFDQSVYHTGEIDDELIVLAHIQFGNYWRANRQQPPIGYRLEAAVYDFIHVLFPNFANEVVVVDHAIADAYILMTYGNLRMFNEALHQYEQLIAHTVHGQH